jgi:hypothetical protein
MLFRPKFCANCGEKIERPDWGLFTSRRFCPVCESEYKGADLVPRVVVAAGILVGIFGIGGYWKSGASPGNAVVLKQPVKTAATPVVNPPASQPANTPAPQEADLQSSMSVPRTLVAQPAANLPQRPAAAEEVYFCGAETKKGTPCSRRVKGNTRCYQHKGMPAMLPPDKLKVG